MIVQREPNEKSSNEDKEDIENLITVPNCFILISCGICEFLAVMVMCIGCSQIVPSFFILMLEKQGLANWPMGGIWLSACFFIKKVLLEHSSIHSFYVSSMAVQGNSYKSLLIITSYSVTLFWVPILIHYLWSVKPINQNILVEFLLRIHFSLEILYLSLGLEAKVFKGDASVGLF